MQDRDFKGVWFPKEIWLNKELDMIEKALLIEIDSLDNEFHCIASNEYFAEFLGVSESKITRSIKKLKELGYIEEVGFDGRVRKLRVVILTRQDKQNDAYNNITSNIYNKKDNTNVLSSAEPSEIKTDDSFLQYPTKEVLTEKKEKKPNLYSNCISAIEEFTEDTEVKEKLVEFLKVRLERKDKPFGINTFKGMLKKLRTLTESKAECLKIIQQSIDMQYPSFFELSKPKYKKNTGNPELIEQSERVGISDNEYEEAMKFGQEF